MPGMVTIWMRAQNREAKLVPEGVQIGHRPVAPVDGDDGRKLRDAGRVPPHRQIGQRIGPDQEKQLPAGSSA